MRSSTLVLVPIAALTASMSLLGCRGILGVEDAVYNPPIDDASVGADASSDTSQPGDGGAGIEAQADAQPQDVSTEELPDASPLRKFTCSLVLSQHTKVYEGSGPAFFLDNLHADSIPSRNQLRVVIEQEMPSNRSHYVRTLSPSGVPDAGELWESVLHWTHQYARLHGAITTQDPPGNSVALLSWYEQNAGQYSFFPTRVPAEFPSTDNTVDSPIDVSSSADTLVTSAKVVTDGTAVHFAANYTQDSTHYAWIPPYITLAHSDIAADVAVTELVRIGTDNYVFLAGGDKGPEEYVVSDLATPPISPNYFASPGVEMLAASRNSSGLLNIALLDVAKSIIHLGQLNPSAAKKLQLSFLKAVPVASITSSPIPSAKVAWIGDDLVMIGPTTDEGGLSILWLDLLGRVRAEGSLGAGAGGKVWKVLAARQSVMSDSALVHLAWTERTQPESSPMLDIVWYNQIRCDASAP